MQNFLIPTEINLPKLDSPVLGFDGEDFHTVSLNAGGFWKVKRYDDIKPPGFIVAWMEIPRMLSVDFGRE